jgi:hypothetical protein
MADTLRFRWRVADGTLHMVWTAAFIDRTFDPASHAGGARRGHDAPDVLEDSTPLRSWTRA